MPRLFKGFCPALEDLVEDEDVFGEGAPDAGRWRVMLASGSRVGAEFASSWRELQREAVAAAAWVGAEVEGPLAAEVASAGDGSTSGKTRALIVEHRERLMGRVLEESLLRHPNQIARPVWGWPERDKLSSQLLLALPGHNTSLTSEEFSECGAALLCLASPACAMQGRKRQGLVPDFRLRVPARGGGPQEEELVLAELKVISTTTAT